MKSFINPERVLFNSVYNINLEVNNILSKVEDSKSRIITVETSLQKLQKLSIKQENLFREALKCIEYKLFKAAYVLSWSAFIDFLTDSYIYNIDSKETHPDIRIKFSDYELIEELRAKKIIDKNCENKLKDLRRSRNEYAHPSDFEPDLNETLGYVSTIFSRIKYMQTKINQPTRIPPFNS